MSAPAQQAHAAAVVEFDHVTKHYDAPTQRDGGAPTPGAVNDLLGLGLSTEALSRIGILVLGAVVAFLLQAGARE